MDLTALQYGIIGGGELGKALGGVLTGVREQVFYYDKVPTRTTTASIEDLVRSCPVLLVCVQSWSTKEVLQQIARTVQPGGKQVVIAFAKGVEKGFVTMDALLAKELPKNCDYGVIYGPMIANEISRGNHGAGAIALSNNAWYQQLRQSFGNAGVSLEASGDMHGIALCGVLKNIYAIAFGVCEGMEFGLNTKGKLAVMILQEMKRFLADQGANPITAEGVAGLGDLLATGFSEESFNYRVGKSLAEGIAGSHIKSEGLVSLDELGRVVDIKKYPVLNMVGQIVFHYGAPAKLGELVANTY